jgi:hypothetical protein
MIKALLLLAALALPASVVSAQTIDQIVFKITSSAKSATPNLRLGKQGSVMSRDSLSRDSNVQSIQGHVSQTFSNYYLTKSTTVDTSSSISILVQVDQTTSYYINSDSTNYLTIQANTPTVIITR